MYVEDPQITLARNLRRLFARYKKQTGISYREFVRRSGIPHSVLWQLMHGTKWPRPVTLIKLCSELGIPVEVLFRR